MKKKICILFMLLLGAGLYLLYSAKEQVNKLDQLIVGVMSGYEPFAMLNEQGELEGFDIDVARLLAETMGKQLVLQNMDLAPLLIALQQNKIDMIISGLCITEERCNKMTMIYYQGTPTTSNPLVFWQKIPKNITGITDLEKSNAVICVEPGSFQENYLVQFKNLNLKQVSSMSEIIMELKYGKSTAAFIDPDIWPLMKQKQPALVSLDIPLPPAFQSKGCGIAIKKENTTLATAVKKIVEQMRKQNIIQKLEQQWFVIKPGAIQ